MAGITDLQYKLMEMQLAGTPEFDAGLYPYQELKKKIILVHHKVLCII
jgi:hypothetical protein